MRKTGAHFFASCSDALSGQSKLDLEAVGGAGGFARRGMSVDNRASQRPPESGVYNPPFRSTGKGLWPDSAMFHVNHFRGRKPDPDSNWLRKP